MMKKIIHENNKTLIIYLADDDKYYTETTVYVRYVTGGCVLCI